MEEVAGKTGIANVFSYEYGKKDKKGKKRRTRFRWISSLELTEKKLKEMICAERGRWKIEKEDYNNQKTEHTGLDISTAKIVTAEDVSTVC